MQSIMRVEARQWRSALGVIVVAIVVGVTYYLGLKVGFWSDDYAFLEIAARLPFQEYLAWYFDPRVQALWYRPIPGLMWWVEWHVFFGNAIGYHIVYVLLHLANCLLLCAIVVSLSKQWLAGLTSALVYAGMSAYSLAVLRPSDETVLAAFFYLLTILFWVNYLHGKKWWQSAAAYASFILALLSKEASVTLPAILLLVDILLVRAESSLRLLVKRYAFFALLLVPYLIFETTLAPSTLYSTTLGYGFGTHMFATLGDYLVRVVVPWGIDPRFSILVLTISLLVSAVVIVRRRDPVWLFLVLGTLVILSPYVPFKFAFDRFLYLPMMFSSVAIGLILIWIYRKAAVWLPASLILAGAIGCIILVNGLATEDQIDWLDRFARENRLPVRTISQWHPRLPDDTLLYFLDPPVALYSGMFFLQYGPHVSVGGDIPTYQTIWRYVAPQTAGLRNHDAAYVYYFDDQGQIKEQAVAKEAGAKIDPLPPVDFQSLVKLDGYELASDQVKRGEAVLVLLYWKTERKMEVDYTVFAHLLDKNGAIVAGSDGQPRNGQAHTSSWQAGDRVIDWIIIPIPDQVAPGADYRLEFGMYDLASMERLKIVDANNQAYTDRITIAPITILN